MPCEQAGVTVLKIEGNLHLSTRGKATSGVFFLVIVWLPIVVGAESGALAAEGLYGLVDNLKTLNSRVATQTQHEKTPTDDVWWTVNGLDMLWNFKICIS